MNSRTRGRTLRASACLAAALAVMGAILQSVRPVPERPPVAAPQEDARLRRPRWAAVAVGARTQGPGSQAQADLGERMYGWNCMPCHGAEGNGDGPQAVRLGLQPRDFTRGRFKLKSSRPDDLPFDEDLFRTISVGFPQGSMPAFADFTPDERWALVDHVKSLTRIPRADGRVALPFETDAVRVPVEPPPAGAADPARGGRLFRDEIRCSQCHGAAGKGDGPSAPGLVDEEARPVGLPDFSRGGIVFKAGVDARDVYRAVTTGFAGTAMPSFASVSAKDRWDLAAYVASLDRPGPPGEGLFLSLGCLRCHTVGRGKLVGPDLAGIGARRKRGWLQHWLLDPSGMISTDEQARQLAREYPIPMPKMTLSDSDADLLVDYLMTFPR